MPQDGPEVTGGMDPRAYFESLQVEAALLLVLESSGASHRNGACKAGLSLWAPSNRKRRPAARARRARRGGFASPVGGVLEKRDSRGFRNAFAVCFAMEMLAA